MNCEQTRRALPELVYGDLAPEQSQSVKAHVAGCPPCQEALAGVERVSVLLDKLPVPAVHVNVPAILHQEHSLQGRRLRRWRQTAAALGAVAAMLVLIALLQVEVKIGGGALIVRWGQRPAEILKHADPPPDQQQPWQVAAIRNPAKTEISRTDVALLRDLIHALAADIDGRDQRQQELLADLRTKVEKLDEQAQERWNATVRYVNAHSGLDDDTRLEKMEGVNP